MSSHNYRCENCEKVLQEHDEQHCDAEGLWFCGPCFAALVDDDDSAMGVSRDQLPPGGPNG